MGLKRDPITEVGYWPQHFLRKAAVGDKVRIRRERAPTHQGHIATVIDYNRHTGKAAYLLECACGFRTRRQGSDFDVLEVLG